MSCNLCKNESEEESEIHLLKCPKILEEVDTDIHNAKYEDIFSDDIEKQLTITKIFMKVFKTKKVLLNN